MVQPPQPKSSKSTKPKDEPLAEVKPPAIKRKTVSENQSQKSGGQEPNALVTDYPPSVKHTDQKHIDKKAVVPVVSSADEETSALSDSDSLSVQSGRGGRITASKKVTKVSRHKVPSKVPPRKRSKGLKLSKTVKKDTNPVPALSNSLPPLRQEPPLNKPVEPPRQKNTQPQKMDKPSQSPTKPAKAALPVESVTSLKRNLPPVRDVQEPDNIQQSPEAGSDDDLSITETESVLSTLTGLDSTKPHTEAPPTSKSPVVSAVSSQVSVTPTDETLSEASSAKPDVTTLTRSEGGGVREGGVGVEGEGEEIEEVLSEDESSSEDTMFEDPLHQSGRLLEKIFFCKIYLPMLSCRTRY